MNNFKSPIPNQPSIELHIEELVLQGFEPGNRYEIADAFQQEMIRLLTEQDTSPEDIAAHRVDAGAFEVTPGARAGRIGAQVAQSIYGALKTDPSLRTRPKHGG